MLPPRPLAAAVLLVLAAGRPAGAQPEAAGPVPRIAGYDIDGSIDPPGRVEAFVADLAPQGSFLVESGAADLEGTPISTSARLQHAFDQIGYFSEIAVVSAGPGQVRLRIHLRAADRVRQIFVTGNWLLRQEEITQRISLRPGQALPPRGPDRDARLELERLRVLDFLHSQGYLDAQVTIAMRGTDAVPSHINLDIRIRKGPGYPIGPIAVRGNHALPASAIADRLRHLDWTFTLVFLGTLGTRAQPFRLSVLRDDLAALTDRYRRLGYAGARLTYTATPDPVAKNVRLQIEVSERKHVEVVFQGNRSVSDDTLRDHLTIFSRGGYGDYEARASAEALEQYYREQHGNLLVQVTWRREHLSDDADRLVFVIDEGPSLKVRGVDFVGNRAFSSRALHEVVNVKVYPLLGLGAGGYATLRQLSLDTDNLAIHYRGRGFPDARVRCEIAPAPGRWRPAESIRREDEPEWRAARGLYVRFLVDEGEEVRIAAIRFEPAPGDAGPLPRDERFLRELLLSRVGAPLQPGLVREDGERLKRYMGDLGFSEASVEPQETRDGPRVTVVWQIKLGPSVHVGPVFVRGNFVTKESTIMLWVPLRTGSPLTTTAVERGERNLALIQLFNNPRPISFPGEGPNDPVVPMLIEVEERHDDWGVVHVGAGASTDQATPGATGVVGLFGLFGSVGYEHRNLGGHGWTVLGQGNVGQSLKRGSASFVDPRFLGSLFRLELSADYLQQATVRLGDIHSGSGSIGLAREMYPGVDATLRYNLRDISRTEFLLRGAGPDEDQQTVKIGTVVGSFSFTVDWQRLDNPLIPTRGFKLSSGVEFAQPGLSLDSGVDTFLKFTVRSLAVVPLTPWLSLRHSVRYDQGLPFGAPVLPKTERFFAGGDTTIRGFELDRARTEVILSPLSTGVNSVQYRPVGGSLRMLHNVDLQFPIAPPWYGAVFIDSGVVADSLLGLSLSQFRHGVGVSPLQLKLPIGDISLSWGWPLDPQPGDARIGRLHVNVGLMF